MCFCAVPSWSPHRNFAGGFEKSLADPRRTLPRPQPPRSCLKIRWHLQLVLEISGCLFFVFFCFFSSFGAMFLPVGSHHPRQLLQDLSSRAA